jgi:hypothetical protein
MDRVNNLEYARQEEEQYVRNKDLEWLLEENKWKKVGQGFKAIDDFLETVDFSEYKIAIDQRKKLAKRLSDLRATQRATGKMLGIKEITIVRDLGKNRGATNVAKESRKTTISGGLEEEKTTDVVSPPPMIAQSGPQAAKAAEKAAKKEEAAKETVARREASRNAPPHPAERDRSSLERTSTGTLKQERAVPRKLPPSPLFPPRSPRSFPIVFAITFPTSGNFSRS